MNPFIDLPYRSKQNMFALIIGIDEYTNCRKLHGAVADAKAMKDYLEGVLRVPEAHIRTLFDDEATRDAITKAFKDLQRDQRIKQRDPIVIFYAGHGGELPAPTCWKQWGVGTKIQCLLPQDYRDSNILPIPDRTIGTLIDDIAKAKGDNICVIFDCCHSASGTRVNNEAYVHRAVHLDCTIPEDLDQDILGGRAGKIAPGFAHRGLQSHVLLAACGEKELAYEHEGRGQFTAALLETLRNCTVDDLTYAEIIERIHLDKQSPHCEGFNQHRIVFDARVPTGRQVRHSIRTDVPGQCVIGAGLAHGISRGVEFTLYSDQKRRLGTIVVDDAATIEDFQTVITTLKRFEDPSFAKLTRVGNLPLYLIPGGGFSSVLEETLLRRIDSSGSTPKFCFVKDIDDAKLQATMEHNLAVLRVLDRKLKRFGLTELCFKATLDRLAHTLGAAAHYYWYLDLAKENDHFDTKNGVSVDFYLLRESEMEYDDYGMPLIVPVEPGLCRRDPNTTLRTIDFVVNPDAAYGIKITNNTTRDLYINAFLFNNSSLSIVPYYIQPSMGTPEAPLKRDGAFTIGYGPGGLPPFAYSLGEGQDIDVGYLKIFLATRPVDLSDIVQLSPVLNTNVEGAGLMTDEEARKARLSLQPTTPTDTWFTLDIPVIQRRRETPEVK